LFRDTIERSHSKRLTLQVTRSKEEEEDGKERESIKTGSSFSPAPSLCFVRSPRLSCRSSNSGQRRTIELFHLQKSGTVQREGICMRPCTLQTTGEPQKGAFARPKGSMKRHRTASALLPFTKPRQTSTCIVASQVLQSAFVTFSALLKALFRPRSYASIFKSRSSSLLPHHQTVVSLPLAWSDLATRYIHPNPTYFDS
jgi:hypothetical protein